MKPYQCRVVEEKREMDRRLESLMNFFIGAANQTGIFESLPEAEQSRLRIQYAVMQSYSTILGERIAHFPPEKEKQ